MKKIVQINAAQSAKNTNFQKKNKFSKKSKFSKIQTIVATLTKEVKFEQNLRSPWRGDYALAVMISNEVK